MHGAKHAISTALFTAGLYRQERKVLVSRHVLKSKAEKFAVVLGIVGFHCFNN